ncbi:MAG TPA: UvrD-helicase domain-containing protein [Rhabdochlamydiaceae bacterium]|nr:UvrD-helicase domain-containing protein [Rhabdochlamydiaceae bacterium]
MDASTELNPQQLEAVTHVDGPLLIIAGAGSGKTRVVTHRILHLLKLGVPSAEILAVTFTNKAAEEMQKRVQYLSNAYVLTATFHALGAQILRESIECLNYTPQFVIFDEDDSEKVLKECIAEKELKDEKGLFKTLRIGISSAKNQLQDPEDIAKDDPLLASIYSLYQTKLKKYNAVDFDDLLFLTVKILKEFPLILERYQKRWSFILIDEYQDTNHAQYTLVKYLAAKHQNVFAVGDPDQSIYSWRGANIQNILNFEKDFPGAKLITLEENYRSRNNILKGANALIQNNESRRDKNLWSNKGEGEKIGLYLCDNEHEEIAFVIEKLKKHQKLHQIPLKEMVIFYRTHSQSRLIEDGLIREKIPYTIIGGISFYMRREIKDILAFLRMLLERSDFLSFARTINIPKRGFGESTLAKFRMLLEEQSCDIFTLCKAIVEKEIPFKLSERQFEGLKNYVQILFSLKNSSLSVSELISQTIEKTGYLEFLKEDPETFQEKRENVQELISKALEWEEEMDNAALVAFLQELSLKTNQDRKDPNQDSVRLMTLHHGKGLEFSLVFLVGMEEELFPHLNSLGNFDALEEERRLCYVGMTRAKEFLYLTSSGRRLLWGVTRTMRPSRFLSEIPREFVNVLSSQPQIGVNINTNAEAFSPGDSVYHQDFGTGIVKKTYTTSFGTTYDVYFPEGNLLRSLVAKYANLQPS